MVPALTALGKDGGGAGARFGVFYVPNGMSMPYWFPKTVGPLTELPATLQSLAAYKDRVLLCGGLADEAANLVKAGGDHARSAGTFLTGVPSRRRRVATWRPPCRWIRSPRRNCPRKRSCPRSSSGSNRTRCWAPATAARVARIPTRSRGARPTTPLPIENDPRAVFERLFGATGSTDPAARLARIRRDRSILDFVGSKIAGLEQVIGPPGQGQGDEYLDSVRDIERRIQMAEQQNTRELPIVDQPVGSAERLRRARQADDGFARAGLPDGPDRISTFMLAREVRRPRLPGDRSVGFPPSVVASPG